MTTKCDFLTVSYSPDESPLEEMRYDLLQCGAVLEPYCDAKKLIFRAAGFGTAVLETRAKFHSISLSGGMLDYYRMLGRFDPLMGLLSTCYHKVTRMDAAYDVPADAADILAGLIAASPTGHANLTRKAAKLHENMSVRDDGKRSGTLYYGHRSKARVTARVYDKTLEALEKRNELLPPTTRYEITVRDGLASLADAYNPTAVFWHYASPVLLPLPDPAPAPWVSNRGMMQWQYTSPEVLPMDTLKTYVSKNMPTLTALADSVGDYGRETALYIIAKQLGLRLPAAPERVSTANLQPQPAEAASK